MLNPILVTGLGRSGTTAMMSLIGTDPAVAFDRVAAFENRQLSYLAKFSLLINRRLTLPEFEEYKLRDLDESVFGPPPWYPGGFFPEPRTIDFFPTLWETFCEAMATSNSVKYYAEKTPTWMRTFVSAYADPFTIRLFRDPRDNFISALAFMRKRGNMVGFGRAAHDSDETFARTICYRWINFYEDWIMNRSVLRSIMVRYEDFAVDPRPISDAINKALELHLDAGAIHVGNHHISAHTVRDSVSRHRSEVLSPEILGIFDECLGDAMPSLDYTPGRAPRFPRVDLSNLPVHDGRIDRATDRATVHVIGPDCFVHLPIASFEAVEVHGLWLAACARLGDHCSVYWRRTGEGFSEERVVHVRYFPGGQWRVFNFDLSTHPLWSGTIEELRLDLFNFTHPAPALPGAGEVTWCRLIASTGSSRL